MKWAAHNAEDARKNRRAWARSHPLVADRLVGDDAEIVKFRLESAIFEEVNLDFHGWYRIDD